MRAFTTTELERMQGAQEDGMMDTCVLLHLTERGSDDYGMPVKQWVEGSVLACGLDMDPKPEWNAPAGAGDETQAEAGEARLRLPIDTDISRLERVRVTHRFGVLLDEPPEYDLTETPQRGPSGLWVRLKRVEL